MRAIWKGLGSGEQRHHPVTGHWALIDAAVDATNSLFIQQQTL
jgi:hypothetical protein